MGKNIYKVMPYTENTVYTGGKEVKKDEKDGEQRGS
jgi:hypothetical protein